MRVRARLSGAAVHFARIVEPCHEKGSGLNGDDPQRKMQDRRVLLGDGVIDQCFNMGRCRRACIFSPIYGSS